MFVYIDICFAYNSRCLRGYTLAVVRRNILGRRKQQNSWRKDKRLFIKTKEYIKV